MAAEAERRRPVARLKPQVFSAFRYRDFRLLWMGQLASGFSQQGEMLTRSWLVLELTNSGTMLALAHVTRAVGSLAVTPIAGVLADRIDRRILLILANAMSAASFLGLGILVLFGWITTWHVIASAIIAGIGMSLQMTASQAVIPSLVPREGIMNAMSLHALTMGISRAGGPLLAGLLIAGVGVEGAFFAATAVLIVPVVLCWFMKPLKISSGGQKESYWASFHSGVKFAMHSQVVQIVVLTTAMTVALGMAFVQMLPLYVTDVLHMGPATVGTLLSLPGILTIVGGLVVANLGDVRGKGVLLFISYVTPCLTTIMLGLTSGFWTAMIAMTFFTAISAPIYAPVSRTVVMKVTPEDYRGRVASVLALTPALSFAVGLVLNGVVADCVGIQTTFLIFGIIALGFNVLYFVAVPAYRRLN